MKLADSKGRSSTPPRKPDKRKKKTARLSDATNLADLQGSGPSSITSRRSKAVVSRASVLSARTPPTPVKRAPGKQQPLSFSQSILGFGELRVTPEVYEHQFPGALSLESEVFCWYSAQRSWFSSTVIHARLATQATENQSSSLLSKLQPKLADDAIVLKPFSWPNREDEYEYYVHFHGEDRRHDIWVVASLLRPCDFEFHSNEPVIRRLPGPDEIHKHMDAEYLREHEENTKLKTIGSIKIGGCLVDAWYFSAYPKEFQNLGVLYVCEFCLNYFQYESELELHSNVCFIRHPPGDEIYRDQEKKLSVFEVDGFLARQYTENLCCLSKLFLDHKTLRHPAYLFLFYVVCEEDSKGYHIVGYFSKEKYSNNNLSCIMCLPQHQRKGYGQFLINLSYALSRKEGKKGTPERPLSDLGKATYIKYWAQTSIAALLASPIGSKSITIEELAEETSIEPGDVAVALEAVGILRYYQDTPFLFLPNEFVDSAMEWSKCAFINELPAREPAASVADQPNLVTDLITDPCLKEDKNPTGRSKRKRTALPPPEAAEPSRRKKLKTKQAAEETKTIKEEVAVPLAKPTRSSNEIAPVNLQNLRWESYDLHLAMGIL